MPKANTKVVVGPPASFEDLRRYVTDAVTQLIEELADQRINYAVPADNVLALLEQTATVRSEPVWSVWESWALRHAIPIHELVEVSLVCGADGLEAEQVDVMRKRLRDLLGYCVLGLVLCERGK